MATAHEILRHVIVIGMLPKSKVRAELIAAYQQDEEALTTLIPVGARVDHLPSVEDIETLADAELVAFIKGAALILGPALQQGTHCICNMRGCVIWPVAAYAALLRRDVTMGKKAWKAFAAIPRLCAERLPFGHPVDLRAMAFEEFVLRLARGVETEDPTFTMLGESAGDHLAELFELARR